MIKRLQQKQKNLQEHFDVLIEKLSRLRKAYAIETNPNVKFKLEKDIEQAETGRGLNPLIKLLGHSSHS